MVIVRDKHVILAHNTVTLANMLTLMLMSTRPPKINVLLGLCLMFIPLVMFSYTFWGPAKIAQNIQPRVK